MTLMPRLVVWLFWLSVSLEAAAASAGFDYVKPLIGTVNGGK